MCIYCEKEYGDRFEMSRLDLNDNLSPLDGGAISIDCDSRNPEDVLIYNELVEHFSWADLTPAEEISDDNESLLSLVFACKDEDDDSDASIVSINFLIYFCPWCGRDLRHKDEYEAII